MELGYAISSGEHAPLELVENAARAEEVGFAFALVSDHFHPWVDRQGQSAFVWAVLGGIALRTERLRIGNLRHVPDDPLSSGARRAGGSNRRRHASRTLLLRRRHW